VRAAEDALAHHQYVSAIDILTGMGLLALTNLEAWRKGRIDFLERVIQGNLKKISLSMAMFRRWAQAKGLRPSETRYVRRTRMGTVDLQFSKSGDPAIEKSYRTHYVSPALSEHKQQQIKERLSWAAQRVVFQILRDSQCSECGAELASDSFLFMEAEQPLCLHCARLGHLELPSGRRHRSDASRREIQRAHGGCSPFQQVARTLREARNSCRKRGAGESRAGVHARCRCAGDRTGTSSRFASRAGSRVDCPDEEADADFVSGLSAGRSN